MTAMSARRTAGKVPGFRASLELTAYLQQVLVDLVDLHLQLDELVDFAREGSDTVAERMRALDGVPDGRSDTVAATTTLAQFPAYEHDTTEVVDLRHRAHLRPRWAPCVPCTMPSTPRTPAQRTYCTR